MARRRNRRDSADPAEAQLARDLFSNFGAALPCLLFFASHSSKHVVGPGLVVSVLSGDDPDGGQVALFQGLPRNNFWPRKKLAGLGEGHLNNLPLAIISGDGGFGAAGDADDPWQVRLPTSDEIRPQRRKLFGIMKPESVLGHPCDEGNWEFSFESSGTEVVVLPPFWRATTPVELQLKTGSRRSIASDLGLSIVNTYSNGDGRTMFMTVDPLCPCKEILLPALPLARFDAFRRRLGLFAKAEEDEQNAKG